MKWKNMVGKVGEVQGESPKEREKKTTNASEVWKDVDLPFSLVLRETRV